MGDSCRRLGRPLEALKQVQPDGRQNAHRDDRDPGAPRHGAGRELVGHGDTVTEGVRGRREQVNEHEHLLKSVYKKGKKKTI